MGIWWVNLYKLSGGSGNFLERMLRAPQTHRRHVLGGGRGVFGFSDFHPLAVADAMTLRFRFVN